MKVFEKPINKLIEMVFGESFLTTLATDLVKIPTDFPDTWAVISDIYDDLFVPLAWCVMLIFFMVHLIDTVSYNELTPEKFLKQFCKLIFAAALVANGMNILMCFFQLGAALVSQFQGLSGGFTGVGGESLVVEMQKYAKTETDNYALFPSLIFIIQLLVPLIASFVIQIVASVICYSRILELMIKTLFAPIPLCDVFSDSYNHSSSMRFFRGYVASCMQAVIIYAIGFVFSSLSADWIVNLTGASGFGMICGYLAINIAAITLIMKSGSMAKELCGAS